ncbi:MAG: hypothetical protein PWP31_413 [Clostridia bacterium]|nr:hypothetical protein [Clostridia bacterium]
MVFNYPYINIIGTIYGYYWYKEQLINTPLIWCFFTPDSPLSTTLFALALIFTLKSGESTKISYEDIGGLKKQVHTIREMFELPLRYPEEPFKVKHFLYNEPDC